ncbi:MAG: PqqD family protein [Allosphingosinicella sp.]
MNDREPAYVRRPVVLHSTTSDGILALHIETGCCFAFDGPSARLWELLGEPITPALAAQRLVQEYRVDEEACRAQVSDHLSRLHSEGLVDIVDGGS